MNSNIDFLSVWLETILFSSTEITDFSSQLSFYLANIKSKIWQLYVIWRHHCQSTRGSYLPLLIFSYKGISILYYSMVFTQNVFFTFFASKNAQKGSKMPPTMVLFNFTQLLFYDLPPKNASKYPKIAIFRFANIL